MKKILYILSSFCLLIIVTGCGPIKYEKGDNFWKDIFAKPDNPTYQQEGQYNGYDFYTVLPNNQKYEAQSGLLVQYVDPKRSIVVEPLTSEDVQKIRKEIAVKKYDIQRIKVEETKRREAEEELKWKKRKDEEENFRNSAKKDVVAQALNYISGYGEIAKGKSFYYPVNDRSSTCVYREYSSKKDLDLNKGNPDAIEVYPGLGPVNPILGEMLNIAAIPVVVSRVDGLGRFTCADCHIERIERAWQLIYSRCSGTRKAF